MRSPSVKEQLQLFKNVNSFPELSNKEIIQKYQIEL